MGTLLEDIKLQSDWIVKAFKADGFELNYTIKSFIKIDNFIELHSVNGKPKPRGRLSKNTGPILFSIGSYVGETFIKNVQGSIWETNDNDPQGELSISIKFPNGSTVWPVQKVIKRFENGKEDSIYYYGFELTKSYLNEPFESSIWESDINVLHKSKPWWKFW